MIDRVARLTATEDRTGGLNPAQAAGLDYLARANRFSRAPSHVADYLGATRGTVSQTLKALERKGLIISRSNPEDRRGLIYDLSPEGAREAERNRAAEAAFDELAYRDRQALDRGLRSAMQALLDIRGGRSFGVCGICRYHKIEGRMRHCALMDETLAGPEAAQICHEQVPA
ncbi:MAG: MarR family transcriptional regulator [Pseudomonadota bacterium]